MVCVRSEMIVPYANEGGGNRETIEIASISKPISSQVNLMC